MQKRLLSSILAAVLCAVFVIGQAPALRANAALLFTPNTTVQSEAAILMNMDIGEIVYEKNAEKKEMPGALVQIMTAVIVLENCDNISEVKLTAPEEMYSVFEQEEYPEDLRYANIEAGDTLTVEDLLYAMLLTSSIEAAYMLTEHFGGSQQGFADLMNAKAESLGMEDTRFLNGTGLYSARQLTTARDMMTLLAYAMNLQHFEEIACASAYTPSGAAAAEKTAEWSWQHSNLMTDESSEFFCAGVHGIKTGNTQEGGRAIACKGARDGNNYLLVCMNAPIEDMEGNNRFYHLEDAKNILEWAFAHLSYQEILSVNTQLGEVRVNNAESDDFVLIKPSKKYECIWCDTTDINSVQQIADWVEEVNAPVKAGDKLGTVTLKLSGETLAVIDVVAASDVERSFWKYNLAEIPGFFRSKYLKNTWTLAIVLSLLYIGACVFFAFRYHEERKQRAAARAGHLNNQRK